MHPSAFQFGPFNVTWYGIMVALGFLAGLWTASRRAVRQGVAADTILDLGPWLIIGSILGARTLYVLSFWRERFADKPFSEVFMVWRGGLVYYGGLVGASLAFLLYARIRKFQVWKGADILAPSVALGHAFGRIGCLLNGCCFGRACGLPWAIRYPQGHDTHPVGFPATPVHPSQIYESLLNLALYAALAWLFRRKRFDGQVFGTYLIGYALIRSFVELFRGDYPSYQLLLGGHVTPAHLVSVLIFTTGCVLLLVLPRLVQHRN